MLRFLFSLILANLIVCGFSFGEEVGQGKRPVLVSSSVSEACVEGRSPVEVKAIFEDPEGDYIVDVQVSWRRVGTKGWTQKRMAFVEGSERGEFETTIYPTGEGEYEVEFRAADTSDLEKEANGKSKWSGRKTFSSWIAVRNHPPVLESHEVLILEDGRVRMITRFTDEDSEDAIVDVQGRWRKRGESVWETGTLEWVGRSRKPTVFSYTTWLAPGVYDFEVEAADAPLAGVSDQRKSRVGWLSMGEKEILADAGPK